MARRGHLRAALTQTGFRRLYAVRVLGQFGDGLFQASLAAAVLFNPEHQARATQVAAGFAVVLLPYSVLGPFAGVLLDRWRRRRTLIVVNLVRFGWVGGVAAEIAGGLHGEPFYVSALVVVSLNRLVLSALSASLPHVVPADELVTANAFSTTSGTVAATVGGAAAVGIRALAGGSDRAYAAIALAAVLPYLAAAAAARAFGQDALGPDEVERRRRETLADVARGLVAGARHVRSRRPAFHALAMIAGQRLCYGVTIICTVLLYRNYFHADGILRSGIAGLAQVVAAVAVGGGLAALITPSASRHLGYLRWPAGLLVGAAAVQVTFVVAYTLPLVLAAALLLGLASQGIKICVDTVVQRHVDDEYRGRVFSLYDTVFNLTLVLAAALTAWVLPEDGHSPASVVVVGAAYLAIAATYLYCARRPRSRSPELLAVPLP